MIQNIILRNIALFIPLVVIATYIMFSFGYASKGGYDKEMLAIYSTTALLQIGLNYLIFKKQITSNRKILLNIFVTVIIIYILYPVIFNII